MKIIKNSFWGKDYSNSQYNSDYPIGYNKKNVNFRGSCYGLSSETMDIIGSATNAKIFTRNISEEALHQVKSICDMSLFKNIPIRIMPDVSKCKGGIVGFSAPVSLNKINELPTNIIGNDIGCGITLVKLNAEKKELDLKKIDSFIREELENNKKLLPDIPAALAKSINALCNLYKKDSQKVFKQIGTLGGGNHFIEIGTDNQDNLYLTVHSGSRQLGTFTKDFFEKAKDTGEFDYYTAIKEVQEYAKFNRKSLIQGILNKFRMQQSMEIDCPHNYISQNGIVRKGAIDASLGKQILIPLNMRDGIIIGKGKGNIDWNCSAPHGSGRNISRTEAKHKIKMEDYQKTMQGIYTSSISPKTIDEAPQAYKDTDSTIKLIADTVEIEDIIKPLYNFKRKN